MSDADDMIEAMILIREQAETPEEAQAAFDWLAAELESGGEDEGEDEE